MAPSSRRTSSSTRSAGRVRRKTGAASRDRREAEVLVFVSQMVAGTLDRDAVIRASMEAASGALGAEASSILLEEPGAKALAFHVVRGDHAGGLQKVQVPIDDRSIAGWVAGHGLGLLIPDAYEDARFNRSYDAKTGFRTRSVLCVPLEAKGRRLGVLQALNRRDGKPFDTADLELAEAVGHLIAVAIHNAEEHEARVNAERAAAVGQAVAGLAHCIKNILNGLQAGSYIIDQNLTSRRVDRVEDGWHTVKRNMGLLSNIVLDMLSYAKSRKPICQPCAVDDLCRDVIDLLAEQARERNVTLRGRLTLGECLAELDEPAIKRALINVVGNAVDACAETAGEVIVETRAADASGRLAVCVRDTGCGMPPEVVSRMFDPFFSTKGNRGTGLGLAVTRKIVEEHQGVISVRSTPGQGTEFVIELPARRTAGAEA